MPWVNEEICAGCGVCVAECPVGAIALNDSGIAYIDEPECIRCAKCHEICPVDAVRHDNEKIPVEVEANLAKTRCLLKHFDRPEEQEAFIGRMIRHFSKQCKVAEQTIEQLKSFNGDLVN